MNNVQDFEESDSDEYVSTAHLRAEYLYTVKRSARQELPFTTVHVNDQPVSMLIDTGASADVIDETTWQKLRKPALDRSNTKLIPYGSNDKLQVLGRFQPTLTRQGSSVQSDVHVVAGDFGCLLGYNSSQALNIVHINATHSEPTADAIIQQFPALFHGVGLMKDTKVKLHIDESIQPVALPHRRVPFHLRSKVEQKIKELEDADIIEEVDGPTPWVSPIVTPPKPNNPTEIRLCVDMRAPNKAILRERHITPTIEDVLSDLNGAHLFSKLDLNQGYHQLLLDESSRYITTFSTHIGLRRYKRLNFGISCASEIFQNTIRNALQGLEGVLNVSDDILVYAKTALQHKQRLFAVLSRLQEKGLTLNPKKCLFSQ